MLAMLMQRIENSGAENENFIQYFENYTKLWEQHLIAIEANAKKHIAPMRIEHQNHGSSFLGFLEHAENLDLVYV